MVYLYSGSSIVALDKSINAYQKDNRFFGEESFYGLYGLFNRLGIGVPNNILHLPFVEVGNGHSTNIYTSIRSYIYDFGFSGMLIVQFLLGFISSYLYILLKRYGNSIVYLYIYAVLIYGTVMQGIEEITLRDFMSITNVFFVLFLMIFYLLMRKRKRVRIW
jgi:oligosaccharide repeat unit polymerase